MLQRRSSNFLIRGLFSQQISAFSSSPAKLNHILLESPNPNANINLIVLHGLLGSSQNFKNILKNEKISQYANSYLLDLRNHGDSEHRESMKIHDMAGDVKNFIKEKNLDSKKVVILGHSMGGRVAMAMASHYSDILHGTVIVDYAPYNYYQDERFTAVRKTKGMMDKLLGLELKNSFDDIKKSIFHITAAKDVAALMINNLQPDGKGGYKWKINLPAIAQQHIEMTASEWKEAKKFGGPVHVIAGEKSEYLPKDLLPHYEKVFDNFDMERDVTVIKDAGHWVHFNKPHDFINVVSQFIAKIHN